MSAYIYIYLFLLVLMFFELFRNYAASLPRRFALKYNEEKGTMEMVQKNPKMPVERTTSEGLIKSL